MGSTRWSDDHYRDRARLRAATGKDAFEHDHAIRTARPSAAVHQKMNPQGVQRPRVARQRRPPREPCRRACSST